MLDAKDKLLFKSQVAIIEALEFIITRQFENCKFTLQALGECKRELQKELNSVTQNTGPR